ncbi:undecaprenyldiphospho-muramoylpentapeptide beta-N-acetylglucosaminyltransferase [Candidatus Omnitrophota bacterium]
MKILIACGGTGGHIFPAISLAEELKKQGHDVLFTVTRRKLDEQIEKRNFRCIPLDVTAISLKPLKKFFSSLLKLIKTTLFTFVVLLREKPDVVVGFGGYVSGPVALNAYLLRIPTIIHEQNVQFGKANALLSKFVDTIAISFQESKKYINSRRVIHTGCPLREELVRIDREQAHAFFGFEKKRFTIMVMGGSLGSRRINETVIDALVDNKHKAQLQVIHIAGENDYEFVQQSYKKSGINAVTFGFFDKIGYAYSAADLLIARAGGSTISEIVAFKLPTIIIPYPFAGAHQMLNARFLSDKGAAVLIEQRNLSSELLGERIASFISDAGRRKDMEKELSTLSPPNATRSLANLVLKAGVDD